jgi:hypothetical protein
MTFSGSPFSVEGIHKGLGSDQAEAANDLSQQERMAALDEAELRDLERAEYSGETPAAVLDAAPATKPRRSILDRLLRR